SKVVVIDPYGDHPVVMTGSHNMGPKASGVNDENLLIIEGDGDLASQYAGQIMEIYSQYRWRQSVPLEHGDPKWKGLADEDDWRTGAPGTKAGEHAPRKRELGCGFGVQPGGRPAHLDVTDHGAESPAAAPAPRHVAGNGHKPRGTRIPPKQRPQT